MTFDEFKQCCKTQGGLDLEALDVAFIQPLKDLFAWWQRQTDFTQKFVSFLGGGALTALIAEIAKVTMSALAQTFGAAVAAAAIGIGFGTAMDVLGRCSLQDLEG